MRQNIIKISVAAAAIMAVYGADAKQYDTIHMAAYVIGLAWVALVTYATVRR